MPFTRMVREVMPVPEKLYPVTVTMLLLGPLVGVKEVMIGTSVTV